MRLLKYRKAVQLINYLSQKNGGSIKKIKVYYLLWLIDRYNLMQNGYTITNDTYYIFKTGIIPSGIKDIFDVSNDLKQKIKEYSDLFIKINKSIIYSVSVPDMNVFSDSDIETIDIIWNTFCNYSIIDLLEYCSISPEWNSNKYEVNMTDMCKPFTDILGLFKNEMHKEVLEYAQAFFL